MLDIIPDGVHRVIDYTCYILPSICGYTDAHNNSAEGLDALLYGPMAVKAAATGAELGIAGAGAGAVTGAATAGAPGAAAGTLIGGAGGATGGAIIGTTTGGLRSLLSYVVGRVAGEFTKFIS